MLLFGEIGRLLATIYDRLRIVGKEDIETRNSQTGLFRFTRTHFVIAPPYSMRGVGNLVAVATAVRRHVFNRIEIATSLDKLGMSGRSSQ